MHFPLHLLLPLASSVGYVVGVLFVKRSADYGVGLWRTTFVSNIAMGVCFVPLWLLGGAGQPMALIWQPLICGALFFTGQIFTFIAQTRGDVSVATPIMGVKVLMVALSSTLLLTDPVPMKWWIAAVLSAAGVALLGSAGGTVRRALLVRTILSAILASTSFALADVLIQKWARTWGFGRFLPLMFGSVALVSFGLIPLFRAPLSAVAKEAWRWLLPGALMMAAQAVVLACALGIWGDATAVNIVYSSRGLWSVVAVWWIGHWFKNQEQHLGGAVMRRRLTGAVLMLAAIILVVV